MIKRGNNIETDFRAFESYIDVENHLIPVQNHHDLYLESGNHSYEFRINLPDQLPTSFEHPLGRIAYKLILLGSTDSNILEIFHQPFSIVNMLDLNRHPYFKQPNSIKITKQIRSIWRGNRGSVTFTLSLLQSGFVPGQHIPFGLIIRNESNRTLKHVYVYLIQQVYIQTSVDLRIVSRFKVPMSIEKGHTEIIKDGSSLEIPPICESFGRSLIKVNYIIMVRLNKKDCDKISLENDYLTIPIFIGNFLYFSNDFFFLNIRFFQFKIMTAYFFFNYFFIIVFGLVENLGNHLLLSKIFFP